MEERNNQQDIHIAKIQKDIEWMKNKLCDLSSMVGNHIPTQIKELDNKFIAEVSSLNKEFADYRDKQGKWLIGILISILMLLLGVIFNIAINL
jgi:hypothetical protein